MNPVLASMKKRLFICAAIFTFSLLAAALFIPANRPAAAAVFGVCAAASAAPLYRQGRRVYWTKLICDSSLITIPAAVVTGPGGEQSSSETVVATFGLLLGEKPYIWGCGKGVRLRELKIYERTMRLKFGDGDALWRAEFPHGMADGAQIAEFAEKIRYETGVNAEIMNNE